MLSMGSTRHQQVVVGAAWLAELDFWVSGALAMQCVTTAAQSITATTGTGSHTYIGLGALVGVANVAEGPDASAEKITLSLSIVDQAMIAATLGNVEGYRGRAARLYLQLYDEAFQPVANPVQRWSGVMDKVQITRRAADPQSPGAASGTIEMQCSRAGMARARHYGGLRLTHQQHQSRWAGDTGLQYMRTLIEQPAQWLSKRFQEQ